MEITRCRFSPGWQWPVRVNVAFCLQHEERDGRRWRHSVCENHIKYKEEEKHKHSYTRCEEFLFFFVKRPELPPGHALEKCVHCRKCCGLPLYNGEECSPHFAFNHSEDWRLGISKRFGDLEESFNRINFQVKEVYLDDLVHIPGVIH